MTKRVLRHEGIIHSFLLTLQHWSWLKTRHSVVSLKHPVGRDVVLGTLRILYGASAKSQSLLTIRIESRRI